MKSRSIFAVCLTAFLVQNAGSIRAQTPVQLTLTTISPGTGQSGVTIINVTGNGFPAGTINPTAVSAALTPQTTGPAMSATVTAVTTIAGAIRRVTFTFTGSNVASPTTYKVAVSGTTTAGQSFVSANTVSLIVNPPAAVSVNPNSAGAGTQTAVTIAGQFTNFVNGSTTASFGPGISVGGASAGTFAPLNVTSATSATAQLSISSSAQSGPRTITVATGVQQATATFTVINAAPVVSAGQSQVITLPTNSVTLQGSAADDGFPIGGAFTKAWSLVSGPLSVTFGTPNSAVTAATFSAPGSYLLRLTASDSVLSASSDVTVNVNSPPVISSVTPNSGPQGRQNLSVTLSGQFTHFLQGTSQASFGSGVTVASVTVNSATSATAILNIDPAAATGARTVSVTTGGEVGTLSNGFTVTTGVPTLLSASPNSGQAGQQNLAVTLTGQFTHFQGTSQASFGGGITVVSLTATSFTGATALLNIDPGAATGTRTVTVTTGGEIVTLNNGFTVNPSTPIGVSISPNSGQQGRQNISAIITGQSSHFLQGASQASFGAGVTVASLTVNSATNATAMLNIDPAATVGGRTVTMATAGEVGTLSNGFTVTAATPSLVSVNPNSGQTGQQSLPVIITGQFTHFLQGTSQASFGAGVTVASLTVNSAMSATAILNIDPAAASGPRTVSLTTGAEVANLVNGFTVTATAPVLLSITPNGGQQGQMALPVTINGKFTHFFQGASQVSFGAGISVVSLTINSPTTASAILDINYAATAGARTVTLTTGSEVVILNNAFTVTAPPPILLSVNPNIGLQGQQNQSVDITGQFTHFVQGTTQASFGSGITVASLTVNSFTSATAVLNIDPAAIPGTRPLTVITGTETETLPNAFTVTSGTIGITVTPSNWSFGNVPISTSPKRIFTITNTGTSPLTVSSINISGAFFTLGNLPLLPLLLSPSGTATFDVNYAPLGTFASNATVTINSNAATSPTIISLTGTGTPPPLPAAGAITVRTDQPVYRRAQPVQITGTLTSTAGAGISNVPVTVLVSINGSTRTLNPFTDAQGNYQATFLPAASNGGTFLVTAGASSGGADRTATTNFRIFGLLVNPATLSQGLVMGNTLAVPLDLLNVGDATLNNVTYSAVVTPSGALSATFPQSVGTLAPGAAVTIPAVLTAPAGNPPPTPVTVRITITATDSITAGPDPESSLLTITLLPAVSTLVLTPPTLSVGVNPGGSLTRRFVVSNQGYAPTNNSTVTLQDPATFNWVTLGNANLGNLAGGASQEFQVLINPPPTLPLGNYTVLFNISGGTNPLQGVVNISVTQSTLGTVSFVVSDDTGAKVSGATVSLIGKTNNKTFQGVTANDGTALVGGVDAGDYTYVVAAQFHDPATGLVTAIANSTVQVKVILSYNVVSLNFTVTPTTITDQYSVTLNVTYSTTLPKPALKVLPVQLQYSFFPEDLPGGKAPCSLSITNTHPTAGVRDISVDASQLDAGLPNGLRIHILFEDDTSLRQIGTLAAKTTTTVACYATLDGDNVPTHFAGNVVVQGTYDYTLDGAILQGATVTQVPVTYTRPPEINFDPIKLTYDQTNPSNPILTYNGGGFVYTVRSERAGKVFTLLKPTDPLFGGHNLAAFTQTQGGTTSLGVMNANQSNVFWHTDFSSQKQSLLDTGDTTTYDVSTLDNGLSLLQGLQAQIAANMAQALNFPSFLAFQGQWSDRPGPTGYLIPIQIITLMPDDRILLPISFEHSTTNLGLTCLNPEDPTCDDTQNLPSLPGTPNQDGQIVIAIDQKIRLERQAFNATLGIGARAVLTNTVASISVKDTNGLDASNSFFVVVTSDPQSATKGGAVSGTATVSWQLIPNAGAGGNLPQGTQYQVQATLSYVASGVVKTTSTQVVTIVVLPSPKLSVSYTAPFVVMAGKDAKIRVTVQNIGAGTAKNLIIQSAQPRIVDTTNPNLRVDFNVTGSSNTADSNGLLPGNLTINFGDVAPGATVAGYWTLRVSRNGFFIDVSSTFSQTDYQGIQLDPLVLPPTISLIPAIGGKVTSDIGPAIPNLTVSLSQNSALIGSDETDANGTYYIPDLAPGFYVEQVADAFGKVWATKNIGVLGDQGTSLIDFVIAGIGTQSVTVTSSPAGQTFTLAGTLYSTPQTLQLFAGSTYAVNFGFGTPQGTGARIAFSGWTDGSPANPRTITVGTSPASYNANFSTQYLLSLAALPPSAGAITAIPASTGGYYTAGTQVQLSPAPVLGHRFLGFSGALAGLATPQTLVVNGPTSVSASFTAPVEIISAHMEPGGVPVNTQGTVQLTIRVANIGTVIDGSLNLVSTTATGTPIQVLGQFQPVSIQPDGSYGDYSISIPVNESSPKKLYFEVTIAARGSLRRVISAPLPLLIYAVPSDTELSQTVTALANASTQFSQTRGTLGDSAALAQVSLSLQQQSVVKSVQTSPDGATIRVDLNDGTTALITTDSPGKSATTKASSVIPKSSALEATEALTLKSFSTASLSVTATGTSDVLVLAPQHALWASNEDPSDAIYNDFVPLQATGRISSLTYLKDSGVTVDVLKNLNQSSVVSLTSHGDFYPGIGSYILTGEPVTPGGDRKYDLDLRLGLVVRAFNPDAGGFLGVGGGMYYAITQAFVDYYHWQGYANSIVYLNSCRSAYDGTLAAEFLRRGAGKVFGHTGLVTKTFGASAGQQLFSVLSNNNLPADQRTTAQAFAAVFPTQDLFSSIVPFGSQDPAVLMNAVFTVTKSGNGRGKVTSTSIVPSLQAPAAGIDCGTVCSIALGSSTTITLSAAADPGMKFNGWGGNCAQPPNDPANPAATVALSQDGTCDASFVVAAKVSLSPFGFLDFSSTPGPYRVQVVAPDGVTPIQAPLTITVNLTKEVTSVCNVFLNNLTVTIPAGSQSGDLDFVAGMGFCNGAYQPTGTKWIINSVFMGPANTRLPTVAGQTILKIFRTNVVAQPAAIISKIWSSQFPGVAINFLPGGSGNFSICPAGVGSPACLYMGTDHSNVASATVEFSQSGPNVVAALAADRTLAGARPLAMNGLSATFTGTFFVTTTLYAFAGVDSNGDGQLQPNEIQTQSVGPFVIIPYTSAQAEALALLAAAQSSIVLYPVASAFLEAFIYDSPIAGATSAVGLLTADDPDFDVRVGAMFRADGTAPITVNRFSRSSLVTTKAISTTAFGYLLRFSQHDPKLKTDACSLSLSTTQTMGAYALLNGTNADSISLGEDPDLFIAIGTARLKNTTFQPTVVRTPSGFNVISAVLSGVITDLYDFNYSFSLFGIRALDVQANYTATGDPGHIFRDELDISGPYSPPTALPEVPCP